MNVDMCLHVPAARMSATDAWLNAPSEAETAFSSCGVQCGVSRPAALYAVAMAALSHDAREAAVVFSALFWPGKQC